MKIITDERCAGYSHPGHPERPERILATLEFLRRQTELPIEWAEPGRMSDAQILRAHAPELLARLQIPHDFDDDTPFYENIAGFARASVAATLDALAAARAGKNVFSLMRPPGHHATRDQAMGFCYLNNIAIAALEAVATDVKRVAVFDFDVHHGNGTEAILLDRPGSRVFQSICIHFIPAPVAQRSGATGSIIPSHRARRGKRIAPRLPGRSMICKNSSPTSSPCPPDSTPMWAIRLWQSVLVLDDFYWLGQSLRSLGVPMFSVLEGGYSRELSELILAYLKGVDGI